MYTHKNGGSTSGKDSDSSVMTILLQVSTSVQRVPGTGIVPRSCVAYPC